MGGMDAIDAIEALGGQLRYGLGRVLWRMAQACRLLDCVVVVHQWTLEPPPVAVKTADEPVNTFGGRIGHPHCQTAVVPVVVDGLVNHQATLAVTQPQVLVVGQAVAQPVVGVWQAQRLVRPGVRTLVVERYRVANRGLAVEKPFKGDARRPLAVGHVDTRLSVKARQAKKTNWPIQYRPVPLLRYSRQQRQRMVEYLANYWGCSPAQVEISRVYDRIYTECYESVAMSRTGQLVCIPKPGQAFLLRQLERGGHGQTLMVLARSINADKQPIQLISLPRHILDT
ncbi:MAG: hypothetical protein R2857_08385 [Vampirovibrionales bacterium]